MTDARPSDVAGRLRAGTPTPPPDLGDLLAERISADGLDDVSVTIHDVPTGSLVLAATDAGLVLVSFRDEDAVMEELSRSLSPRVLRSTVRLDPVRRQLDEYFDRARTDFELDLDWALSRGFRRQVLDELTKVPYGATVSYAELARRAGNAKASRAVGSAMATNPLPIVVPCHRVLRTGGALGGYAGGLETKRHLLALEGVALDL